MLSKLRTENIVFDSVLRLVADRTAPEIMRVVATLNNFFDRPGQRSSSRTNSGEANGREPSSPRVRASLTLEIIHRPTQTHGETKGRVVQPSSWLQPLSSST